MNQLISQTEVKSNIENDTVYSVFKDTHSNQIFLETGKKIKAYFRKNYGIMVKTWVDFLNSGKLPQGKYLIFEIIDGKEEATKVYEGFTSSLQLNAPSGNGKNRNNSLADQLIPIANSMNSKTDMRTLAESMSMHTSQTIQTLQDELRSKDDFVVGLQAELSKNYDMVREREREIQDQMKQMQEQINKLEIEKIELTRKLEMEIWKNNLKEELFRDVRTKEKELDAKEKEMNSGNMLKDLLDTAKPLIQTVGMGLLTKSPSPMMPTGMAGMNFNRNGNAPGQKPNFEPSDVVMED